jgi:hypothetical protein
MALHIYEATLKGLRPGFMPQSGILADSDSEEAKLMTKAVTNMKNNGTSEARRQYREVATRLKLYVDDDDRPIIPSAMLQKAVYEGAVVEKAMKAAAKVAGITVTADARLIYDGPETAAELAKLPAFQFASMVTRQKVRVFDCRPIFKDWSAKVRVEVDTDMIEADEARQFLVNAGRYTGIGSWRPKLKGGKFGRWNLTGWNFVESLDEVAQAA